MKGQKDQVDLCLFSKSLMEDMLMSLSCHGITSLVCNCPGTQDPRQKQTPSTQGKNREKFLEETSECGNLCPLHAESLQRAHIT